MNKPFFDMKIFYLPEPYRFLAKTRAIKHGLKNHSVISSAFTWPKGEVDFWEKCNTAQSIEDLPGIPSKMLTEVKLTPNIVLVKTLKGTSVYMVDKDFKKFGENNIAAFYVCNQYSKRHNGSKYYLKASRFKKVTLSELTSWEFDKLVRLDFSNRKRVFYNPYDLNSKEFNPGDTIEITEPGENYSDYTSWANKYNLSYYKTNHSIQKGEMCIVIAQGKHLNTGERLIGLRRVINGKKQDFILGINGVKKVETKSKNPCREIELGDQFLKSKNPVNKPFSIGDVVQINDPGKQYNTYDEWAEENNLSRYIHKKKVPFKSLGKIIAIAPHQFSPNKTLVGVRIQSSTLEETTESYDIIIEEIGVEKVNYDSRVLANIPAAENIKIDLTIESLNKNEKYEGKIAKVHRFTQKIRRGENFRGSAACGKQSRATIKIGHLSNQTASC